MEHHHTPSPAVRGNLLDETQSVALAALLAAEAHLDSQDGTPDPDRLSVLSTYKTADLFVGALVAMQILCQTQGSDLEARAERMADMVSEGPMSDAVALVREALRPADEQVVQDSGYAVTLLVLLLVSELETEAEVVGVPTRQVLAGLRRDVMRARVEGGPGKERVVVQVAA